MLPNVTQSPQILSEQTQPPLVEPLTLNILEQYPRELQPSIVGERLFPLIAKNQPTLAGKITGMLLDRLNYPGGTEELLHLLEDNHALIEKLNEALEVLEAHAQEIKDPDNLDHQV